jgi:hypothetical protein
MDEQEPASQTTRSPEARAIDSDTRRHPTWPTVGLLVGTTLVIVVLALASSYGWL